MGKFTLDIRQMGAKSVLIEWPQRIEEDILEDLISYKNMILEEFGSQIVNHTPAYASLLLQFEDEVDFSIIQDVLYKLYNADCPDEIETRKVWHIPVCYDQSLSTDLSVFSDSGISHKDLVSLHTSAEYRIYMIGFLPGFLYLGGLDERLQMPRKTTPNLRTPKGAVAIGGQQTGIYPIESPGGWHVIGRTPLELFDIHQDNPTPIKQGDVVKFYEINLKTYEVLAD